jgi:cysteine desulfurase
MKLPIYLDYMATTPVDKRVKAKMCHYLDCEDVFGNPASSAHAYGWQARDAVELARAQVAAAVNAEPNEIIWTAGATEANNLAIKGAVNFYYRKGRHIVTCQTEHKAVLDPCRHLEFKGCEVTYLKPEPNGLIDVEKLEKTIRSDTVLVSIMAVNNEIGVIHDLAAIGKIVKAKAALFHVDAAQAIGKISIDLKQLPVDLMSFSAHKSYGPKGIGALYVRRKPRIRLEPQIHGGGHEFGLRSGTLPPHQIVGMGEAFQIAVQEQSEQIQYITNLRDKFWAGLSNLEDIQLNGDAKQRVPHNLNIYFGGIKGVDLLPALKNLAISSGSACDSTSLEPSHVLRAIGLTDHRAFSSVRFSLGKYTTVEEIDFAIEYVSEIIKKLRT